MYKPCPDGRFILGLPTLLEFLQLLTSVTWGGSRCLGSWPRESLPRNAWPHHRHSKLNTMEPPFGYGSIPINTILVGWTSIYQLFWCSAGVQGFDTLPFWAAQLRLSWWRFRFPMLLVNSGFPMLSQGFLQFFPFFPPIFHPTIPQSTCRTSSCTSSASSAQRVAPDASWNFAARLRYASRCQETNTWIKV